MKKALLNHCVDAEEARLYDFVNACNIIETDRVSTMGVDNKGRFFINKSFYESEKKFIIGLILHESLHIYFDHVNRKKEHHRIANIAQDIVINNMVDVYGYDLPDSACTYESIGVPRALKTSDEIYEYLLKNAPPEDINPEHGLPDEETDEHGDIEELKRVAGVIASDMHYQVHKASEAEHKFNDKPQLIKSINMILGKVLAPEFIRSYTRPPRHRSAGLLLPSSRAIIRKPSLSIYLDVSGSMQGGNINKSLGILKDLHTPLSAYNLKKYIFNTKTEFVDSYDDISTGGGTSFESFHENDNSDVAIIITDCEFPFDFLERHNKTKVIIISMGAAQHINRCEVFNA